MPLVGTNYLKVIYMVSDNQVLWLNYLKEEYGHQLKEAMIASISSSQINQISASQTAATSLIMGGLITERQPTEFYEAFQKAGGDVEYLKYATQCFKEIRSMFVQQ